MKSNTYKRSYPELLDNDIVMLMAGRLVALGANMRGTFDLASGIEWITEAC